MEITIKIDDEEIQEMATRIIAEKIVKELNSGHGMGFTFLQRLYQRYYTYPCNSQGRQREVSQTKD